MSNIVNNKQSKWKRVWEKERFDDLYNQDERYFAILTKGLLSFLNRNVVMKGKSIPHYIMNSGSEYIYVEQNGYEYSMNVTSGENTLYSKVPRCIVEIGNINIVKDELTSPYSRGYYERVQDGQLVSFNSEMRRLPIQMNVNLKYQLSDFNESIILVEEFMNNFIWQKYFNVTFLGNVIQCSIQFPDDFKIDFNKIDFESTDNKNKTIQFDVVFKSNYPQINDKTETPSDKVIKGFSNVITDVELERIENGDFDKTDLTEDERQAKKGGFIVNVNPTTKINGRLDTTISTDNNQKVYNK